MVNAHRTGAHISKLRKTKDWTQLELADKLHVTHQAVSQWEQGSSFPDIGLLPQLGRLLGVSVDDLLNGEPAPAARPITRGAIVEELARGNLGEAARLIQNNPEGIDMMLDAAPLARPSQFDEVVANLGGIPFTLRQIVDLAPFVSQARLQSILEHMSVEHLDVTLLVELAPFVDSETLDWLVPRIAEGALDPDTVGELAPFLRRATLRALVLRLLEADNSLPREYVQKMAPFLDQETLELLIQRLPEGPLPIEYLVELAPFASRATLDGLLGRLEDPAALGHHLHELAPFLSQAGLKQAIGQHTGGLSAEELLAVAPFLDRVTLEEYFRQGAQH